MKKTDFIDLYHENCTVIELCRESNEKYDEEFAHIQESYDNEVSHVMTDFESISRSKSRQIQFAKEVYTLQSQLKKNDDGTFSLAKVYNPRCSNDQDDELTHISNDIGNIYISLKKAVKQHNDARLIENKVQNFIVSSLSITIVIILIGTLILGIIGVNRYLYLTHEPFECNISGENINTVSDSFPLAIDQYWTGSARQGFATFTMHMVLRSVDNTSFVGCSYWEDVGKVIIDGQLYNDIQHTGGLYPRFVEIPDFSNCANDPNAVWIAWVNSENVPGFSGTLGVIHYGCLSNGIISGYWNQHNHPDGTWYVPPGEWQLEVNQLPVFERGTFPSWRIFLVESLLSFQE